MRRRLEEQLRRIWKGDAGPGGALLSATLLPFEVLYAGGVALRNRLYDRNVLPSVQTGVPVVSVGNLVVGGAGKTPVAGWLARMLADNDLNPAIVTRGYGEDEVLLHRRWNPDVAVVVDADRVQGARTARERGAGVVILDDGFQHRRIRRDLDIVLHPAEEVGRLRLLPRGPYREPLGSLERADHLIITRRTASPADADRVQRRLAASFPDLPLARIHLRVAGWTDLNGEPADPPSGSLLAVTAIARPESFARLAERASDSPVELMSFPDHHEFSRKEREEIRRRALGRTVVTTEKDAARLAGTDHPFGETARVLRLQVVGESGMEELERALAAATGRTVESDSPPTSDRSHESSSRSRQDRSPSDTARAFPLEGPSRTGAGSARPREPDSGPDASSGEARPGLEEGAGSPGPQAPSPGGDGS